MHMQRAMERLRRVWGREAEPMSHSPALPWLLVLLLVVLVSEGCAAAVVCEGRRGS